VGGGFVAILTVVLFGIVAGPVREFLHIIIRALGLWVRWIGIALVALRPFRRGDPGSFGQKAASTHARCGTAIYRAPR
jgi:hypothetical protein